MADFRRAFLFGCALLAWLYAGTVFAGGTFSESAHADTTHGVLRDKSWPRGSCFQCHGIHAAMERFSLFAMNDMKLCYATEGCHIEDPPTGGTKGYPAQEEDRYPVSAPQDLVGYFEYSQGTAVRVPGTNHRVRWPGRSVWTDTRTIGQKYVSPHFMDPDMPLTDQRGRGHCANCHEPHGAENRFDMLRLPYLNVDGRSDTKAPENYELCFSCHSMKGPVSELANRYIEAYYDRSINADEQSGHQFRGSQKSIVGALPPHIRAGDKMPCYDCHNVHGSRGNAASSPNLNLISDQRTGWSGLTDTINDALQQRAFCLGCHSDNQFVEGIQMKDPPENVAEHSDDVTGCYDCHADADPYANIRSRNVHHPSLGN